MSVIIYSTPTCPYCAKAKSYLREKGIAYEDIDVSTAVERQEEMMKKSGQLGVPVIDINGNIIVGFDKAKIDDALEQTK